MSRDGLVHECLLRRVKLHLGPPTLSTSAQNSSYCDKHTKEIFWRLEWTFFFNNKTGEGGEDTTSSVLREQFQDVEIPLNENTILRD